jgi:nitrite reductase/ring-hydroxylating ferredoxin subunit
MLQPSPDSSNDMLLVCSKAELDERRVRTVSGPNGRITVFSDDGAIYAVDNRCPHMGFPLDRGSVKDGILTCHWHQARFDLTSGCTFDLFADDVPRYEVRIDGGDVYVSPAPIVTPDAAYHRHRLRTAVELNVPLVQAKSLLGLLDLDAQLESLVGEVARFAAGNLGNFGEGLVRLTCVANLYPLLSRETAYQGLLYGIRRISEEVAGSVPRRAREPLDTGDHDIATLKRWMRQWVQTRHRDASERTLLTVVRSSEPHEITDFLAGAASERLYANTGHVFDATNKALELSRLLGEPMATEILPLLMPALTQTRGEEESTDWRHPIEIVEPLRALEARLAEVLEKSRTSSAEPPEDLQERLYSTLAGDDPLAILTLLEAALRDGMPAEELARHIARAASLRLARFATSNEVTDWFGPQHTLNFANAVHQTVVHAGGAEAQPGPDAVRAIFHAAIAVYMDRYLNVPPAKPPGERALSGLPSDGEPLREALLQLLDQRAEIDAAAALVVRYLRAGHATGPLIDTLTFAAVREDIDFHCLQVIEASARQCAAWTSAATSEAASAAIENILVGAVRNLAAHCPTQRAGQQTANIALRLHRGDHIFEEATAD